MISSSRRSFVKFSSVTFCFVQMRDLQLGRWRQMANGPSPGYFTAGWRICPLCMLPFFHFSNFAWVGAVDTAWNGFQEKQQQHKWKSRPRWYNHFVQHEHFCKHVGEGGMRTGGWRGFCRGRRQGFCVRWDGVNRQIGSRLHVSSLRFHAGWIYRESQCIGIRLGLLWGPVSESERARSCELEMINQIWIYKKKNEYVLPSLK